jgi:ribosomal protein S18 acetylase RimI-like enzyme
MSIKYLTTDQRDIDRIEPLWLNLIEHHKERSQHFKAHYDTLQFENRKIELLQKSKNHPLHIQLAENNHVLIGYCVSSVTAEGVGEVDSILVEKSYRRQNIGETFMGQACRWLDEMNSRRKVISVAAGNEGVFGFYSRFGFYPLAKTLVQILKASGSLPPPKDIRIVPGQPEELDSIQPLWEKLQRYHGEVTPRFTQHFEKRVFTEKKAAILKTASSGELRIDLVRPAKTEQIAGYCVSTISQEKTGMIETFYLEPEYRGQRIGNHLMQKALDWMDERHIDKKMLMAAAGNTRAIKFYAGFYFYPVNTKLQQI